MENFIHPNNMSTEVAALDNIRAELNGIWYQLGDIKDALNELVKIFSKRNENDAA